jgi:hypothetical protein
VTADVRRISAVRDFRFGTAHDWHCARLYAVFCDVLHNLCVDYVVLTRIISEICMGYQ